ncbi:MAG: helix-turn-helix domain-containing protein [Bacteroidota bacterium]
MRCYLSLSLYLLCFLTLHASTTIDSLLLELEKAPHRDRVTVLLQLAEEVKYSDTNQALAYAQQSYDLAKALKDNQGKANALMNLGSIQHLKGDFVVSNQYLQQAIDAFQNLNDAYGMARSWYYLGANAQLSYAYDEAMDNYSKALDIFQILADSIYILKVEGNFGSIQYLKGNFDEALRIYNKMIAQFRYRGNPKSVAINLGNAGLVYTQKGNYSKALENYFAANEIIDSLGQLFEKGNNLSRIGTIFENLNMMPEAIATYEEGLAIYEEMGQLQKQVGVFQNLTICYLKLKDFEKAEEYLNLVDSINQTLQLPTRSNTLISQAEIARHHKDYDKALELLSNAYKMDSTIQFRYGMANCLEYIGYVYNDQKEIKKAEYYLKRAYHLWKKVDYLPSVQTAAEQLATIYEKKKDWKQALKFRNEAKAITDSLFSDEQQNDLMRLLIKKQLKEKEQANEKQPLTITSEKASFLPWLIFGGLLIASIFWWYKRQKPKPITPLIKQKNNPSAPSPQKSPKYPDFLHQVDQLIERHMEDPTFNVSQLTKLLGINQTQLRQKMKEMAQVPPSKYIQIKRLETAERLLKETQLNISEIAHRIGFEANYFTRVFNQKNGVPPNKYRKIQTD